MKRWGCSADIEAVREDIKKRQWPPSRTLCRRCAVLDSKSWDRHQGLWTSKNFCVSSKRQEKIGTVESGSRSIRWGHDLRFHLPKYQRDLPKYQRVWEHRAKSSSPPLPRSVHEHPPLRLLQPFASEKSVQVALGKSKRSSWNTARCLPPTALWLSPPAAGRGGTGKISAPSPSFPPFLFTIWRPAGKVWRISPSLSSWLSHSKINSPQQRNTALLNKFSL